MSDLRDNIEIVPGPAETKAAKMPPSTAGLTTKVVKGSLWTLAGQVLPLAVSLVTTPFVIRLLGAEGYGVLILVGLIPTYLGFADFGMSMASTKFGSEAYAEGDEEKEGRIVRTAALIALLASLPISLTLFLLSWWITALFNVPERLHSEASFAVKIAAVTLVINFLNSILNAPQLARLRMDMNTMITTVPRMLGIIATPIVIYLGGGIVGAIVVVLAAVILTLIGNIVASGRILKTFFASSFDLNHSRQMLSFGITLALASIAGAIITNFEKIALPGLTSVTQLAYYSVAFTLAYMMTLFSVSMAQSLIPAFSRLQGESDRPQLSSLYSRAIRMNLIWLAPILVILGIFGESLIALWAGREFSINSALPFGILLIGVGFHVVATPARASLMASGRSDVIAKLGWAEVLPYTAIVAVATYWYGGAGAAAAWSLRSVFDCFVSFYIVHRVNQLSIGKGLSRILPVLLISTIPIFPAGIFGYSSAISVFVLVICMLSYGVLVWNFVLEKSEVGWILERFRALSVG